MVAWFYRWIVFPVSLLFIYLFPPKTESKSEPSKPTDVYKNPEEFLGPKASNIKPCPACGGEAHFISCIGRVSIACGKCGLMTPLVEPEHWDHILSRWQSRV